MAEFDITVDKDGHNQFLQQERPYWPMVPTQCTVPVCRIFGPFSSFKNIGAKSTLKFHHFTNARAGERSFLTINMPKPIQNPKYIKDNPLQLNAWSLRIGIYKSTGEFTLPVGNQREERGNEDYSKIFR